jgi:crossover junction endodeoxyribonuclease RusA
MNIITPDTTTIRFRPPARLLSMNDRHHWSVRARLARDWRLAAQVATRNAHSSGRFGSDQVGYFAHLPMPPSVISIVLPVRDSRRRDPHNYFATVKPIVDGLVDAGLWPDDTPEWVTTTEPTLSRTTTDVHIIITPRAALAS